MKFSSHEISDALRESLIDRGIVDKTTEKPNQDYFELPIAEGPILGLAQKAYDMKGFFHVGCAADERPPNFSYIVAAGDSRTKKGRIYLKYSRELRLKTFFQSNAFRKQSPVLGYKVRDLEELSKAFNEGENYREELGIEWNGWSGMYSHIILPNEKGRSKCGFCGKAIVLEFENGFCTGFDGINNISETEAGFKVPFQKLSRGTRLEYVVQTLKDKVQTRASLHDIDGVKVEDLMTGILQVAEKALPAKVSVRNLKQEIAEACSGIKIAPKDYAIVKEHVNIGD